MRIPHVVLFIAGLLMTASLASAQTSDGLFLKLDGLLGESQVPGHEGEIGIQSFSFGASQTGIREAGGRASARRSSLSPITITKFVDKSSPNLFLACALGTHINTAVLAVRKGGDTQDFLVITLSDVLISSYNGGGAEGSGLPTESVS